MKNTYQNPNQDDPFAIIRLIAYLRFETKFYCAKIDLMPNLYFSLILLHSLAFRAIDEKDIALVLEEIAAHLRQNCNSAGKLHPHYKVFISVLRLLVIALACSVCASVQVTAQTSALTDSFNYQDIKLPANLTRDIPILSTPDCAQNLIFHSGIAMHGAPALPDDFDHFTYANPSAPKGGTLRLAFSGTFDSLNPLNVRALTTAQGINGNIYQSLLQRAGDEPFSLYGLLADKVATDEARTKIAFHLNPKAQFSDGHALTTTDVLATFLLLKSHGRPQQRAAYQLVKSISITSPFDICFDVSGSNDRELPLTLGFMPVLPAYAMDVAKFDDPSLAIPLGSGPYVMKDVRPGDGFVLQRNPSYWGDNVPSQRGLHNFATIRISYYRDTSAMFEAFKAGLIDFWLETEPTRWLTGYDFPAMQNGSIKRASVISHLPKGMEGFTYNLRRPQFQDVRVREALSFLFDFEWLNTKLYNGLFTRTTSYFADSALASTGKPASAGERALLKPFPDAVRADILMGQWRPPVSDGSGRDRTMAKHALDLLEQAGYAIQDGVMRARATGKALSFEIIVRNTYEERLALDFAQGLSRLGITASIRLLDDAQYLKRRQAFDFDMMIAGFIASPSPGNEQRGRFASSSADFEGSYNVAGVKNPAVDALIAAMLSAKDQSEFEDCVRAYDRVLLSGFYLIPLFHSHTRWIAYNAALSHPDSAPLSGFDLETWWLGTRKNQP